MKNSQLIETLKTLDKNEFREFGKFVSSPYHNNRSEVVRFYEAVKKFYPSFESKGLTEEKLFKKVYPGKKFSIGMIRKVFSLTLNLVMDYYAINSSKEDALEYSVKLLHKLHEKKLDVMFEKRAKNTNKLLLNSKHTFSYYESKFKYTSILFGHRTEKRQKSTVFIQQEELNDFTEFFISILLLLYVRLTTKSYVYNVKYDLKFYNEVIKFISTGNLKDVTLVSLYYNMLMLFNSEDEKYFFELLKDWNKFESKLINAEQHNIYIILSEYCIKRIQKGDNIYMKKQFDITKTFLNKNLTIKEIGYMEPYFFTNVVRNASGLKEFKWLEDFINKYKSELDPEIAREIISYSFAMIEFDKCNYEKSLKHLSTINPESLYMKLHVKNLLIMNLYELDYKEELLSQIDAYKHFLQRDKSAAEHLKQRDTNFIKLVAELIKIKLNKSKEAAKQIKKEIETAPYFDLKNWLMQKVEELCK